MSRSLKEKLLNSVSTHDDIDWRPVKMKRDADGRAIMDVLPEQIPLRIRQKLARYMELYGRDFVLPEEFIHVQPNQLMMDIEGYLDKRLAEH